MRKKKITEEYIYLAKETINNKNKQIDDLMRLNRDVLNQLTNFMYEFREYIKMEKSKQEIEKNVLKKVSKK